MRETTSLPLLALLAAPAFSQSGVQSDDFNTASLEPIWSFVDPLNDTSAALQGLGTPDAQLRFDLPQGQSHNLWFDENWAPRVLQSANNTDLFLEAKFDSQVTLQYQMQGIVVQESMDDLLRFEVFANGNGQVRVFAGHVTPTASTPLINFAIAPAPSYLRVERVGDQWTMSTSADGIAFAVAGTFSQAMTVTQVGVHAGNHHEIGTNVSPAFTALVDYFFNMDAPILNEDGPLDTEPPLADAGPAQAAHPGDVVTLDGTASVDDWTAPAGLLFDWTILSSPAGSTASISGAHTSMPTLLVDALGDFVMQLTVTDEAGLTSEPATVLVSSLNQAPVADAGADELVEVDESVVLDGLGSSDADVDALTYFWTIVSAPSGSAAVLVGANSATPSLTPDVDGEYVVELLVNDGYADSETDAVTITAGNPQAAAIACLREASRAVRFSPWGDFRRWYFKYFLRRQLRLAAWDIKCGHTGLAVARLQYLESRVDGCAERGAPDGWWGSGGHRSDWVVDCDLQLELHACISEALGLLQP